MPTKTRVNAFIKMVLAEQHAEAIEQFYHEDASIQENLNPPRRGRDLLVAHEKASFAQLKSMQSYPPLLLVLAGDHVVIQWQFDIVDPAGQSRRLQEVSVQRWLGSRILTEQFFYDSATAWQALD